MKRLYLVFTLFLSSFFLFSTVFAEEYSVTITDEMFSYLDNIDKIIELANSYCLDSSNTINCNYFIRYHDEYSYKDSYFLINKDSSSPKAYIESSSMRVSNDTNKYVISSDFNSISTTKTFYNSDSWRAYEFGDYKRLLLYSSFDIPFKTIDNNTYTFIYKESSYSIINDGNSFFPTLYDLFLKFKGQSNIDDNLSILSKFYTTMSDNVILFANCFIDNYILISIICIFIFLFLFEFIRRYFL